ncbi:MAG: hypothetical protein UT64_C0046G0001, partial [Candidatus Falkowbacteria bacterium GW2011_GWF2_39_8]
MESQGLAQGHFFRADHVGHIPFSCTYSDTRGRYPGLAEFFHGLHTSLRGVDNISSFDTDFF